MEKVSPSHRCFKSICIWSLLSDLIVILSFIASYSFVFAYKDWGYVGWIIPLFVKILFTWFFAIANGYLAFILFCEYKKNYTNLPLFLVIKTENIFYKLIRTNTANNIINTFAIISFVINLIILVLNLYTVLISLVSFLVCSLMFSNKK